MVNLSDRAVLANLKVSRWGRYRRDENATDQVHKNNDVSVHAGNYNKRLLSVSATKGIESVISAARDYHRFNTLPWLDDGVRMLPASKYMDYAARLREFQDEFDKEVRDFVKSYPKHIESARKELGKLFNIADYPAVNVITGMYRLQTIILPFPDKDDFRVDKSQVDLNAVQADMEERMKQVWSDAMKDVAGRIAEVVGRMSERLKAYKPAEGKKAKAEGTFRDSLVENVRDLVAVLPSLNMAGDKKLAKLTDRMNKELCKLDADDLRTDDVARAKVAKSADDILTAISDFIA